MSLDLTEIHSMLQTCYFDFVLKTDWKDFDDVQMVVGYKPNH